MARKGTKVVEDDEEISDEEDADFEAEDEDDDTSPKKSKKRKSQFVDDAAEEDDDEDEDDEDEGGAARRKGPKRNRFIDDIAAVDEEEEDEEDEEEVDDLIGDEADEVADQQELQQVYRQVNQRAQDEQLDPEALEAFIKERFQHQERDYGDGDYGEQAGMVSQQGLLPTHQDPKLWLVETRTGQEREACIRLMQKSLDMARTGSPLAIKSCFAQDHLQGYMYVEAFKESHVLEAVRGLRNVLVSKGTRLVPLGEMVEAITVNTKAKKVIDVDSWVRMRRFPYQGDMAKVIDVDVANQRAQIRFVPRLDYAELGQKASAALNDDGSQKKKATRKNAGVRPPARAFSKQEAERYGLQPQQRMHLENRYTMPSVGGEYENGYEVKWLSMRNIVLDEAGPSVEELTRFNQVEIAARAAESERGERDPEAEQLLASLTTEDAVRFDKGDKVKVTEGDLQGLWGYVHAVRDDGTVLMMPQLKGLNDALPFPPSQLAKTFEVGDHVKVTGGKHAGQTGMVVKAEGKICTLVSDTTKQELNCFTKDLSESADVSMGLDTFGKYELHDLVVLDQQTTGLIIGVDKDSCRVLTTEGTADNPKLRICRQPDIKRKFPDNRRITAPDANGNSISVSDIVTIKEGRYAGRAGTVKFVVRGSIFLQSREVPQHSGFVCLRSRGVIVKGAKAANGLNGAARPDPSKILRSPAPHLIAALASNGGPVLASPMRIGPSSFSSGRGGRGGQASFSGRGMPVKDGIVGKTITVAKGPYKGYKGRVVNATETHVRMELEAQYKTVTVPRTVLPMADGGVPESANSRRSNAYNPPATPGYAAGSRTPAYAVGSRTPMHAWGSRTPIHPGSMTPSHPGSATPMHDSAWAAGPTPGHASLHEDRHRDSYRDASTPYTPLDTPGLAGTPFDTGTPAFGYGAASTPGLDQRTPGTVDAYSPAPFEQVAQTPGMQTGLTPAFADSSGIQSGLNQARLYQNVLVTLPDSRNQPGVVRTVDYDGRLLVELGVFSGEQDVSFSGKTLTMSIGEVSPLRPRKNDRLRVLEGNEAGSEGTLTSIAEHEGVVKLADNAVRQQEDIIIVNMAHLGRLAT